MTLSLDLEDSAIKIDIRTSKRAKRLHLISGMDGVQAIVPAGYDVEELYSFISSKKEWIIRTSQYYNKLMDRCGGYDPGTIYFLGSKYHFHIVKDRQQSVVVSDSMKLITFHVVDRRKYKEEMQQWYKEQTGKIVTERLATLADKLQLRYNRVSIKSQRSRWGSCSRKGNLNFNLLLAAAPMEVIDYVIIHELMHLIEMDHSQRFWRLVEKADPDYKKHKDWLTSHAPVVKID